MNPKAVLLRGDASHALGAGHVMRLTALADAAQAVGAHAQLAIGGDADALCASLRGQGYDVVRVADGNDVDELVAHAHGVGAIVLDAPLLLDARAAVDALGATGVRVAAMDDGAARIPAPIIINPNYGAEALASRYADAEHTLLGRSYALLRAPFLRFRHGGNPRHSPPRRVLLTFGGSDPLGATPRAIRALEHLAPMHLVVVVGANFLHHDQLAAAADLASHHTIERLTHVEHMAALIATCDAAISGAGGTLAELAYLGCPTAAFAVAADQIVIAAAQARAGLVHGGLDLAAIHDAELGESLRLFFASPMAPLAARAAATVDGQGASRVINALIA